MDKKQSTMSYEDDKSDSGTRSGKDDKMIDFPTSGNSTQFKIESGYINNPFLQNRTSYNKYVSQSQEERTIKIQIFLNIEFTFNDKVELLKITQEVPPKQFTIDDVIRLAITGFNEILEERKSEHRINPIKSIWNLYMSKKNGKPKQDLPALDRDNLLQDTQEDMFSLDTKDSDKLWDEEKYVEYEISKEEEGEEQESVKKETAKEKPLISENMVTQITNEIQTGKIRTSVAKLGKMKNEGTRVCGLCSFSK